jgi:hypothetical protein
VAIGLLAFLAVAMAFASPMREWLVGEDGSSLQTVAQVVPATVVAIFVFALGAVFVIAQIVIPR